MRLEPFAETHVPLLDELLADPDALPGPASPSRRRRTSATTGPAATRPVAAPGRRRASRRSTTTGDCSGSRYVPTIDREAGEAELGYMVTPSARGRGVGSAILRELTAWAFGQGIQRCELVISAGNTGSERVAERAGYVREGTLRSIHLKQGKREDVTVWSRLPTDPEPQRSRRRTSTAQ